jgi:hypothetical protein
MNTYPRNKPHEVGAVRDRRKGTCEGKRVDKKTPTPFSV